MGFHRIHMVKVLQHKARIIPSPGSPIDDVRLGGIGGEDLSQELTLVNALPSALHKGSEGFGIRHTVQGNTLHRSHGLHLLE
jgi:hypothetical protein